MTRIVEKMKKIPGLTHIRGCSEKQIVEAQKVLDIIFPDEYIEYVKTFGCIDFDATEWTGLNIEGRLNTVVATNKEKQFNKDFPKGFFVLENLEIDGKIVIVNQEGKVYLLQFGQIILLCNSMSDYLDLCTKKNPSLFPPSH